MNFKFLYIVLAITIFSCNTNEEQNTELIGTWKLIQTLSDPGDGSGTFQTTSFYKTIKFNTNNTFTSSSTMCNMFDSILIENSGSFNQNNLEIYPENCQFSNLTLTYYIENNQLIINYPCFEQCAEKYIKTN